MLFIFFNYRCQLYFSTQRCYDLEFVWKLNSMTSIRNLHTKSNIFQEI